MRRETEALLAVLDGDESQCRALLAAMPSQELHQLRGVLGQLREMTSEAYHTSRRKVSGDDTWF
jgi:hypothetical protein